MTRIVVQIYRVFFFCKIFDLCNLEEVVDIFISLNIY